MNRLFSIIFDFNLYYFYFRSNFFFIAVTLSPTSIAPAFVLYVIISDAPSASTKPTLSVLLSLWFRFAPVLALLTSNSSPSAVVTFSVG